MKCANLCGLAAILMAAYWVPAAAQQGQTIAEQREYLEKLWKMLTPEEQKAYNERLNAKNKTVGQALRKLQAESESIGKQISLDKDFGVESTSRKVELIRQIERSQVAITKVQRSQRSVNAQRLSVSYLMNTSIKERETATDPTVLQLHIESISVAAHPSYLVCGNEVLDAGRMRYWANDIANFAKSHLKLADSVGRVQCSRYGNATKACTATPAMPAAWQFSNVGTAFVVREDIMVTNRHVVEEFAQTDAVGRYVLKPGFSVRVDFPGLYDGCTLIRPGFSRTVAEIYVAVVEDIAFLRFKEPGLPKPLSLALQPPPKKDEPVIVVGYPERDDNVPRNVQEDVFRGPKGDVPFGVRRLQPGVVTRREGERRWRNDASALNGNSGSPVVRLADGRILGIHVGGYPGGENVFIAANEVSRALEKLPRAEADQ